MRDYLPVLEPETTYHIYNHANGLERIFFEDRHYHFFLKQYTLYITPICETFSYCLMPNHFHLLVRIRPQKELERFFDGLQLLRKKTRTAPLAKLLTQQFSNLFNSYTQSVNKDIGRMGSIFMKNYRRLTVSDQNYLLNLVRYIHRNPLEAGISKDLASYKYSSYKHILRDDNPAIDSKKVLGWFDSARNFKLYHEAEPSERFDFNLLDVAHS
jgi:putative transposase